MDADTSAVRDNPWRIRSRCDGAPIVYDGVRVDLCPALRAAVLARSEESRRRRPGGLRSSSFPSLNEGGWKSTEDLFSWPDPAVRELRAVLRREYQVDATIGWAMVNRLGSHHPRHHHGASVLSGVYYVDPGEEGSAPTVFERARQGESGGGEIRVEPAPGRLALFPGDLWHWVPEYTGTLPRITIAFDVRR